MAELRIQLLGKLSVQRAGRQLEGFEPRKVQELLCYLAIYRHRPHARESLADLLWGDLPGVQAKKHLRQSLWQLQTALGAEPGTEPLLMVEPDWIQFSPTAEYWLDVVDLERALVQVREQQIGELAPPIAAEVQHAVELYHGDLLEGSYQDWCLFERERLQSTYLGLLDRLIDHYEARREYAAGLDCGEQILRYDHARECTHRRIMRLCYLAGDRTGAVRQYNRCVRALESELGVGPARQTVALYDQICADTLGAESPCPSFAPASSSPLLPAPDLVGSLRLLQQMLDALQSQIQHSIETLERNPSTPKTLARRGRDSL